jgi:hypothetical protein
VHGSLPLGTTPESSRKFVLQSQSTIAQIAY